MRIAVSLFALLVTLVLVLALPACNSYNEARGRGDAPIAETVEEGVTIVESADGYPNIQRTCDGSTAVYQQSRKEGNVSHVQVVPNSPECGGAQ